ncbi:MAG: ABC transporter permease [Candidatus Saganbacteria bacterium]|nr:ABC transporter permease [Candidatus Saganbacteria bacterium]
MVMIELRAIYILWLREMKKFTRAKERIIGSIAMPFMFLAFLGFGFGKMSIPGLDKNISYMNYLVPGTIGMNMLFSSMFAGISVLWDREFGFLKEIMVAPVSRISIALGRIAGGATTGMIQGILLFFVSFSLGFNISYLPLYRIVPGFFLMIVFMVLMALVFLSLGLSFASNMKDAQGFELIINFVMFPLFFLSGAVSPISNLPVWIRVFSYLNPLTYGVDGIRWALLGSSHFHIFYDLFISTLAAFFMVSLASYFFERSEGV